MSLLDDIQSMRVTFEAQTLQTAITVPAELLTGCGFDLAGAIRDGLVSGVNFFELPKLPLVEDATAVSILRAWCRKPWDEIYKLVLRDRLDELDRHDLIERLNGSFPDWWFVAEKAVKKTATRTRLRAHLRWWKRRLKQAIPFES